MRVDFQWHDKSTGPGIRLGIAGRVLGLRPWALRFLSWSFNHALLRAMGQAIALPRQVYASLGMWADYRKTLGTGYCQLG